MQANCNEIQQTLSVNLSKANSWLKLNEMQHNNKRSSTYLLVLLKKLYHSETTALDVSLDSVRLEESVGEKLLGVVIDPYLSWDLHIDYLIKKLKARVCLH